MSWLIEISVIAFNVRYLDSRKIESKESVDLCVRVCGVCVCACDSA